MAVYNYITNNGVIIPDVSSIITEVSDEYKDIFGDDFITDPETPEGQLINVEAEARESVARNNATLANQINPNTAGGVFLDAIWALTGGQRNPATRSTVSVDVGGANGTVIPIGARARTTDGDLFENIAVINITTGGTASGIFQSVEAGPIPAGIGTLTTIVDQVIGWDTITNPDAAVLGSATETDVESRNRRKTTLALQGNSTAEAIASRLNAIPSVQSIAFRENVENSLQVIDGLTLVAHSVRAVVNGGSNTDVANALWEAKSAGANWNGNTTQAIVDPVSGQSYDIKFDRPDQIRMLFRVTIRADSVEASDPNESIPASIVAYANGEIPGEAGFVVGADVSPFEISSAININNPEFFVTKVEIDYADTPGGFTTDTLPIALDEIATAAEGDVTVVQI